MIDKIREVIERVLREEGAELVDIISRRESGRQVLRILADKEGGITLMDCANLNEKIARGLDENGVIEEGYALEVDSPGIGRFFKTKRDFERASGWIVRVTLNEAVLDKKEYIGRLQGVLNGSIKIDTKKKGVLEIPFEKIVRARQEVVI